ncbi:putative BPI/LBP family protein [Hirschfeldia incana]|nr:putative BPI/LBP family protein [Hirschfeldia incana]
MVLTKLITFLALLFFSVTPPSLAKDGGGHVSLLVSETGLDFAKDFLVHKAISTTLPLELPEIEKKVKIPLVGKVSMGLSNIKIYAVDVRSSRVETGGDGIVLSVSGATADVSMDWSYAYKASFFHISDHGVASVKVKGMDLKTTVSLVGDDGSLKIASRDSDCKVKSIGIHIHGGASWLYQGVVDAFEKKIISTIEDKVSNKILEKMKKLDAKLQSLPKEGKIDDNIAVNLTFTGSPVLDDSSVEFGINGLFMSNGDGGKVTGSLSSPSSSFPKVKRMMGIAIKEEVFNSATLVYFIAKKMHVDIQQTKNGSALSTSDWKQILPELYKEYPNVKMMLNMSVTSPPAVNIRETGIDAIIDLEISIDVQNNGVILSVARMSTVLEVAGTAEIAENKLAGSVRLNGFNATMTWSKLGDLQANYIQDVASTILESLFLPYVNTRLKRGFPLPFTQGFKIKNTEIAYVENSVMVSSDVAFG